MTPKLTRHQMQALRWGSTGDRRIGKALVRLGLMEEGIERYTKIGRPIYSYELTDLGRETVARLAQEHQWEELLPNPPGEHALSTRSLKSRLLR